MKEFLQKTVVTKNEYCFRNTSLHHSFLFIIFTAYCILITNQAIAQSVSATTKEKEFLIGDWIPVDLFANASSNNRVAFPNLKDSISETIEVANFTSVDTIKKSGQYEYHQLVNLIVFDTGKITLPQFQFFIENNGKIDTLLTTPITVHVAGVKIDTTKDIKDIKEPLKIPITLKEVLPYIIGFLVLALLVAIALWYFLIYRKKKEKPVDEKLLLPPHIWALKALKKLQNKKLWQAGEIKSYYSELTDIARTYIELRYKIPAMEKTTDELMQSLHKGVMKQSLKNKLKEVLELSDFVKFAKAQPDLTENEASINIIKEFIESTKPIEQTNTNNSNVKKTNKN